VLGRQQQRAALILFTLIFTSAISSFALGAEKRADEDNLTRAFAEQRRAQIKAVDYELSLVLTKGSDEYKGHTNILVELNKTDLPLSIDFMTKKIESVRVNGDIVTDYQSRKGSFDLPTKYLAKNMEIEVDYTSEFSKTGDGFQKVKDPADGAEYAYTDFEPYAAHTLMPCFDQPDLKGTLRVTIDAPSDWRAIANDLEQKTEKKGDRTTTVFTKSKAISTYLFFVGAGPFVEWKDKEGSIPLVLYARKSLAKHVDFQRIFDTTKKGLRFYANYFGAPYPFPKFGQIFVPEFSWGGMENPGAITLNERNIFRGAVTDSALSGRDDLILHEMAHMWFGDLVTMRWWNDLWLNESFATYAAVLAKSHALGSPNGWIEFFSEKTWGYWQDSLVTTHPIETDVKDVRTAKSNIDGITYAKGGSALKQLHFFVGENGFRDGLRSYFKAFAWQNTRRTDFVDSIAKASNTDLKLWSQDWLQTAGANRVQVAWKCKDGLINEATLQQTPSVSKTLSPHRTQVGFFKLNASGTLEQVDRIDARYDAKSLKLTEAIGKPCPAFVYPNVNDQDYALFSLDAESVKLAGKVIAGAATDPLLRLMVWDTLYQMVRDSKLSLNDYFNATIPAYEVEKSGPVLGVVAGRHSAFKNIYLSYLAPEERAKLAPKLEGVLWKRILDEKSGKNLQLTFFDFYLSVVQTPEGEQRLRSFLDGKNLPKGITLDQDRRWKVLERLAVAGAENGQGLLQAELKRDPTTTGQRNVYASTVAQPSKEAKDKFWNDLKTPDKTPMSHLEAASRLFNSPNQQTLAIEYVDSFFKAVKEINWDDADQLVDVYFSNLFPASLCSKELLKQSQSELKSAKKLTEIARRAWLEGNDELNRCVTIREGTIQ
jgi:aminopeptidase N